MKGRVGDWDLLVGGGCSVAGWSGDRTEYGVVGRKSGWRSLLLYVR